MSKARVLIFMEGGIIQQIISNDNVQVRVFDYDTEGISENEIISINDANAYISDYPVEGWNDSDIDRHWMVATSETAKKEANLHEIARLWIEQNDFGDRSLDEISDHELTHEQKRFYDFLTEEFNKL